MKILILGSKIVHIERVWIGSYFLKSPLNVHHILLILNIVAYNTIFDVIYYGLEYNVHPQYYPQCL